MSTVEIGRNEKDEPIIIDYNEEFSFNRGERLKIPDNTIVYSCCFSQEEPDTHIFREDMTGVSFYHCNLDNVFIPAGNSTVDCSENRYQVQNDLNDWLVDENNNPIKPFDYTIFEKLDLPLPDPQDIPIEKVEEIVDLQAVAQVSLAKSLTPTK